MQPWHNAAEQQEWNAWLLRPGPAGHAGRGAAMSDDPFLFLLIRWSPK